MVNFFEHVPQAFDDPAIVKDVILNWTFKRRKKCRACDISPWALTVQREDSWRERTFWAIEVNLEN